MLRIGCVCVCLLLAVVTTGATEADLRFGVLIAHHPPGMQYSPSIDWCEEYFAEFAITSCVEQNPRIDLDGNLGERSVWYVLTAWGSEKEWCGGNFGLGAYESDIYYFLDAEPCHPGSVLELSDPGWPGPMRGTTIVCTGDSAWVGNMIPVYCFSGYAYYEGTIPLGENPSLGFGGTGNCESPSRIAPFIQYGAMGVFRDGSSACPTSGGIWGAQPPRASGDRHGRQSPAPVIRAEGVPGPNPRIVYCTPQPSDVTVKVFDVGGRLIDAFEEGHVGTGQHSIPWIRNDAEGELTLPSGVYFLRLEVDGRIGAESRAIMMR